MMNPNAATDAIWLDGYEYPCAKGIKLSRSRVNFSGKDTNDTIFAKHFFPIEGYSRDEIQPFFDKFYEKDFIKLKKYTKKKPESRNVVQHAFDLGYDVIIATTPVLPLTAIHQRLNWAGVGDFKYKLITTIENSRATKPNLMYYRQIVEFLGYPPESCLMVGDEDKDMVAAKINCLTFLNHSSNTKITPNMPKPTFQGKLLDLKKLL